MITNFRITAITNSNEALTCVSIEQNALASFSTVFENSDQWPTSSAADYTDYITLGRAIGAWHHNCLVGFLVFDPIDSKRLYLAEIDVSPCMQGQGAGSALLAYFIASARAQGITDIYLRTFANTPWSIKLYQQHDFVVCSDKSPYLTEEISNEINAGLPMDSRISMRLSLTTEN